MWTLEQFHALPQDDFTSDIHCVTAWSRYDNHWRGVSSRTLLELVKPKPEANHVIFQSYDGYTTNVTLAVFCRSQCAARAFLGRRAAAARAWRAGARRDPRLVFLEKRRNG